CLHFAANYFSEFDYLSFRPSGRTKRSAAGGPVQRKSNGKAKMYKTFDVQKLVSLTAPAADRILCGLNSANRASKTAPGPKP
uniref:Uncharacterized protein n=1 Tax=Romanomermis culicivorax TaxID=13658 RepID=A0A915KQ38_ROMCU